MSEKQDMIQATAADAGAAGDHHGICLLCHRPFSKHSFDTRDICNMFLGPDDASATTVRAWKQLDALRGPEGHTVTLLCDNPDFNGRPNCAIDVCGDWTDWEEKRFEGDTMFEAINNAHLAFTAAPPESNDPLVRAALGSIDP